MAQVPIIFSEALNVSHSIDRRRRQHLSQRPYYVECSRLITEPRQRYGQSRTPLTDVDHVLIYMLGAWNLP
jgi:hypothetical protein